MPRKSRTGTRHRATRTKKPVVQVVTSPSTPAIADVTTPLLPSTDTSPTALSATSSSTTLTFIRDMTLHGINLFGTGIPYFWMNVLGAIKMLNSTAGAAAVLTLFGYASERVNLTLNLLAMQRAIKLINEMQKSFSQVRKTATRGQFCAYASTLMVSTLGILSLSIPSAGAPMSSAVKGFDTFFNDGLFLTTNVTFGADATGIALGTAPEWMYIGQNSIALFALSTIRALFDQLNKWFMKEEDLKVKTQIGSTISALEELIRDLKVASPEELETIVQNIQGFLSDSAVTMITDSTAPSTDSTPVTITSTEDSTSTESTLSIEKIIAEIKSDLTLAKASSSEIDTIIGWVTGVFYWSGTSSDIIAAAQNEKLGMVSSIIKWLCGNNVPTPLIASLFNITQGIFSSRYAVEGSQKMFDALHSLKESGIKDPIAITKTVALIYALGTLGPTVSQMFLTNSAITAESLLGTANTFFVNNSVTGVIATQDISFFKSWTNDGFLYASGLYNVASWFGCGCRRVKVSPETRLREAAVAVIQQIIDILTAMPYDHIMVPAKLDAALSAVKDSPTFHAFEDAHSTYTASKTTTKEARVPGAAAPRKSSSLEVELLHG